MFAIKTTQSISRPLRQSTYYRQFSSKGNKSSSLDSEPSKFQRRDDLHAKGLDEQAMSKLKASVLPKEDIAASQPMDWSKKEKKQYEHPIRDGIDKLAEQVEHGGAKASESFTASKSTTERAAHIANRGTSDRAAHSADGVKPQVEGAKEAMGTAGKKIADATGLSSLTGESVAASVNDVDSPDAYRPRRTSSSGFEEPSMMDNVKETAKEGMDKFSQKMSGVGQSIAGSFKGMEGMADSLSGMSMPKSVSNAAETIKESIPTAESIKGAAENAAETIKNSIPSMDAVKETISKATETVKASIPSMPSADAIKGAAQSTVNAAKDSMPSTGSVKGAAQSTVDAAKGAAQSTVNAAKDSMPSTGSVKGAAQSTVNAAKDSMPSADSVKSAAQATVNSAKGAAQSVKDSMPSADSVKSAAQSTVDTAKGAAQSTVDTAMGVAQSVKDSMPSADTLKSAAQSSVDSVKNAAQSVKDSMPSADAMKQSAQGVKETVSDKVAGAKDTANAAMEASAGVFDQFKQGMATMKEAMKPIIDYSSEKIKEGVHVAQEKIPPMAESLKEKASMAAEKIVPMAQSMKEKATQAMHSPTAESIKESVASGTKAAYVSAKDTMSTVINGPKETDRMEIKENTKTINKEKLQAKDQEMSSSDTYKP